MSQAHKGSKIVGEGLLQSVDSNTLFLAHYDITEKDVLNGISPIINKTTLSDGKFGGGIIVDEGTLNYASTYMDAYTSYYQYTKDYENNIHNFYRQAGSTSPTLALKADDFTSAIATGNTTKYTVSGFLYLNNVPFKTEVPHLSTYHTNTIKRTSRSDGYFEYTQTFNSAGWFIHSNLCNAVVGDTIKIDKFQLEIKPSATRYTSFVRENGQLYYPANIFNYNKGTFSCWAVTNTTLLEEKHLFFQWDSSGGSVSHFGLKMKTNGTIAFSYGNIIAVSPISYNDGNWHCYTVTWDDTQRTICLYVDGIIVATATNTVPVQQTGGRHMSRIPIGHRGWTYSDQWWNGTIDEVRIDSIPRTAEEIQAWYISGAPFFPRGVHTIAY